MMQPSLHSLLLLLLVTAAGAHFSFPGGGATAAASRMRVIDVTSAPSRTGSSSQLLFGQPRRPATGRLYASTTTKTTTTTTTTTNDIPDAAMLDDDNETDEIPDHFERVVDDASASSPSSKRSEEIKAFKDLNFAGKLVRGTRNLVLVTGTNFCLGGAFGASAAAARGFPNLMTRKEGLLGTPWTEEIPLRFARYSAKCARWAGVWAPVLAVWGFADTAASLLFRNGENDEYSFMVASAAAAAWHNRERSVPRRVAAGIAYAALTLAYVKVTEKYIVGTEGWDEKYKANELEGEASSVEEEGSIF